MKHTQLNVGPKFCRSHQRSTSRRPNKTSHLPIRNINFPLRQHMMGLLSQAHHLHSTSTRMTSLKLRRVKTFSVNWTFPRRQRGSKLKMPHASYVPSHANSMHVVTVLSWANWSCVTRVYGPIWLQGNRKAATCQKTGRADSSQESIRLRDWSITYRHATTAAMEKHMLTNHRRSASQTHM